MSSPIVAPAGSGTPVRRGRARAHFLALVAIVSVVGLFDSEILVAGIAGIAAGFDLLRLPAAMTYAAIGLLCVLTLWLTVWLVRTVWRVEHELDAAKVAPQPPPAC